MAMGHTLIMLFCLWPLISIVFIYSTCPDDQYFIFRVKYVINVYSGILNFHKVKTIIYLFILIYTLGWPLQHNLYSCLSDLECAARGRFTPLTLYFISPTALYMYLPPSAATLASVFATLRKYTDCCMHKQMHPRLQTLVFLCWFDVSNIRSYSIICSLINVGAPQ